MNLRLLFTLTSLSLCAAACGDDGEGTPVDAPAKDIGFNKPTTTLKAHDASGTEIGPADMTCLNTPANDLATTVAVTLNTKVRDFQSGNPVPNAVVTAFAEQNVDGTPFFTGTADGNADIAVLIPVNTKRFGYKMTDPSALDTLLLNQTVNPTMPVQTLSGIQSVSKTTAQLLPALIGISRTAGTGVLAGAMRDCAGKEVSGFIATVSSTKGTVTHLAGADTYYFSPTVGLPVKHNQQPSSSADGLFMIVELPPTASAFVQVWGYPTEADLTGDQLKLVAELPTKVIAETVITGSYEPLRTP